MEGSAERGQARRSRAHGGVSPDAFVWWLRGYLEAGGAPPGVQGALADVATIRDMLAHVPFDEPALERVRLGPVMAQNSPCGCGGTR